MKKTTLLKKMRYNRKRWNLTVKSVIKKGLENDPVSEKWILKDVIAHLTWYERELIDALERKSIVKSEFWNTDVEKRNEMIFKKTQNRTLDEHIEESEKVFEDLIKTIELLSEDNLNSDHYVKRKEGTRITHDFIGGINFWHYEEHEDALIDKFDLDYQR